MSAIDFQSIKQRFGIVGNSPLLEHAIRIAVQVAPTDMSVLVMGESGVGKETFPKIIHQYSVRKHNAYIAVNCGAIPEGTIDSELFGHIKGSFTGALADRKGYFEEADGGTIFLDEVGELPLATQARLLRVLETGEFIPVGASKSQKTDVRIVAATNVNLAEAVEKGRFREDLLFRLNTVPIEVPPLRDRPEDIPLLFRLFAARSAEKYHMPALRLTPEAQARLVSYPWPGNVRELRNLTDRISVLESDREVSLETLSHYLSEEPMMSRLPVLSGKAEEAGKSFTNEREMLWGVLFDVKKDVAELKNLLAGILSGTLNIDQAQSLMPKLMSEGASFPPPPHKTIGKDYELLSQPQSIPPSPAPPGLVAHEAETLDYEEHPLSLEEMERNLIAASMRRHRGVKRAVAKELKIAERTLYRKLKEYGLEDIC